LGEALHWHLIGSTSVCPAFSSHGGKLKTFTAVIERDTETGLLVGHIPGFRGAHSQGATMEELEANLAEVVAMLLEDGEPNFEAEFVGTQTLHVA
jgi:predicted RNase H-like HicB family nuclease